MKSTFALGIALVLAVALGLAACSINHRSGDFACTKTADCNTGRDCVDGFCIVPGSQTIDAPTGHNDAPMGHPPDAPGMCPAQCSTCDTNAKTCTINCQVSDCSGDVQCPPGYACDINCNADNTCTHDVDCSQAKGCAIFCEDRNGCANVTCGAGPCNVMCGARQTCQNVDCSTSCKCDVTCTGLQSCEGEIDCPAAGNTALTCTGPDGNGCSSTTSVLCDTCMP